MPEIASNGGKVWLKTKKDLRDLSGWMKKGKTVFVTYEMATNLAPYEDDETYSAMTCTGTHPLIGGWMFGATCSLERLLFEYGPVFEKPPAGLRDLRDPEPQVAGPLPKGKEHGRKLTARELAHLQALTDEADARSGTAKRSKKALGNRWS